MTYIDQYWRCPKHGEVSLEKTAKPLRIFLKEQEGMCREIEDFDGLQRSLGNQGLIHTEHGDFDRAMVLQREKEQICRKLGKKDSLQITLGNLAVIHLHRRNYQESITLFMEQERICRDIRNVESLIISLANQSLVLVLFKYAMELQNISMKRLLSRRNTNIRY